MEIQIPSPSVFLRPSPVLANAIPAPVKNAKTAKPRPAAPPKATAKNNGSTVVANAQNGGVVKPKQSKSRNGKSQPHVVELSSTTIFFLNKMTDHGFSM